MTERAPFMTRDDLIPASGYAECLNDLKGQIRSARLRAALSVNRELVLLYWRIGQSVLKKQAQAGWGAKVIDQLSHYLRGKFPEMKGFSARCALPTPQPELAQQLLKDPYNFDFLSLGGKAHERDLERGLLAHLRDLMLELGVGFAFVGSQVHLEVGGEDFYLDLLFYHLHLRCYVVIDLKIGEFMPEYVGKMNFYLSAVDNLRRHPQDAPSIGLLLCRTQNRVIVEYALRGVERPLGVSSYELAEALPDELRGQLPSVEELERELEGLGGKQDGE